MVGNDRAKREAKTAASASTAATENLALRWAIHWCYPRQLISVLEEGVTSIGRGAACDILLNDESVSRQHALLTFSKSGCKITDAGSTHGVRVNGEQSSEKTLADGAVLRLGKTVGVVVHSPWASQPCVALRQTGEQRYLGAGRLKATLTHAETVATTAHPVFINGETGTGKEQLAEAIHEASGRPGPYIAVNCSTLRGDLILSKLFGHQRGAFTGASSNAKGALEAAHQGTLFLDEVAELPDDVQPILLRFLQSGEYTPLGTHTPRRANVRIISATHRELRGLCNEGRFRRDLYERLVVHQVLVPHLRQRREDILPLFEECSQQTSATLSAGFVESLLLHDWTGNIRQLHNLALDLKARFGDQPRWGRELLIERLLQDAEPDTGAQESADFDQWSREEWQEHYKQAGYIKAELARVLGIPATNLKRRLNKVGIK